jgi:hypothetical protein
MPRSVPTLRATAAIALWSLGLGGCQRTDPYVRPGLWRPTEANDANLRAMVADPADLVEGRGATLSSGDLAAAAVARLRADAVKPLPDSSIAAVRVSGAGAAPAAPTAGGTAADAVTPAATPAPAAGGGP